MLILDKIMCTKGDYLIWHMMSLTMFETRKLLIDVDFFDIMLDVLYRFNQSVISIIFLVQMGTRAEF
jgi:hypothetical protein